MGLDTAWRLALPLALALPLGACVVNHPEGWPSDKRNTVVIRATPGHMYGFAPTSWDVPGGGTIRIELARAYVASAAGAYRADIAFTAALDGEAIHCETDPKGAHVPRTRFGCWSTSGGKDRIAFWMNPGAACAADSRSYFSMMTTPGCWRGVATLGDRHVLLEHGYEEATDARVGYISWTAPGDRLLLAADIVTDMQVRLYLPAQAIPPRLQRRLMLLTVALSWWEHASEPD
jgi:hypothetical protein